MGRMKNTIPENPVCSNFCKEICVECQYEMETSHIYNKYRPTLAQWYNERANRGANRRAK